MSETQFLSLLPNILCIAVSLVMAYRVYSRASIEHRQSLLATFVLISMLALVLGIERFIQDRNVYAAMVVLEYAVCIGLLLAILSFSLCYTGQRSYVNRRFITVLLGMGAGIVVANASNGLHHLFYESYEIVETNGLHMMQPEYGPLFYIWLIYAVGILAFVMGWLLKASGSMMGSKRRGTVLIVLGLGFYTFMGILNTVVSRDPRVDMLTIGLLGAAIMVYAANRTSSIIEQHGMTMEEALRDMDDGVVIEDPEHRVMYMNDTARELRIMDRSPYLSAIPAERSVDIHLDAPDGERKFNVKRSVVDRNGVAVGTVTVMRDVTESRTTEKRLALANHRLDTMARALRHDIMNELTVLHGHMELLSGTELEEKQRERLEKARKAAVRINDLIEKTREQHILDPVQPKWQDLEQAIRDGIRNVDLGAIRVRTDVGDLQILADPMFPTVFSNLMDNSLRHGGSVKEVRATMERKGQRTLIVWEDDGQGIPSEEKERIFEKGIGKNTGMGLFLIREILEITGMDIREEGVPGKGARFIISVPASSVREKE